MRSDRGGFTIIETMIVLGVSGFILVITLAMLNGRQGRVEFSQGVRELDSQLKDVLNDVSTGFYPTISNLKCVADTSNNAPVIDLSGSGDTTGTNTSCVFAGKVIQYGITGSGGAIDPNKTATYVVAGRRLHYSALDPSDVNSMDELKPVVIDVSGSIQTGTLPNGIEMINAAGDPAGRAIGVFFSSYTGVVSGLLKGGNSGVSVVRVASSQTSINNVKQDAVKSAVAALTSSSSFLVSGQTVDFCLKSVTSKQYAVVSVIGNGNGLTTKTTTTSNLSDLGAYTCV